MREILFRGKRKDNNEWITGDLARMWNGTPFIMPKCDFAARDVGRDDGKENGYELALGVFAQVISESVGQFTGLTDKNGNRIFEGDLLLEQYEDFDFQQESYYPVVFDNENSQWAIDNSFKKDGSCLENIVSYFGPDDLTLAGNLTDNPELLKTK